MLNPLDFSISFSLIQLGNVLKYIYRKTSGKPVKAAVEKATTGLTP
jgi:hypothetical protein